MANYDLTYEGSVVQGILDTGKSLDDNGYIFMGAATTSTAPGTPTDRVAYIGGPGTYNNFGSTTVVPSGSVGVFKYNGSAWVNDVIAATSDGCVYAGIATPTTNPGTPTSNVFYVAVTEGIYTNFGGLAVTQGINILKYNGSAWSVEHVVGIDDEPIDGSNNLVKSGGVQNELALGAVYDVSAKNPTAGPNNDGRFESLSALLSDANLNTLIPTAYRKGGMSIKFIQSSDNKYVCYMLTKNTWDANPGYWQKINLTNEVCGTGQESVDIAMVLVLNGTYTSKNLHDQIALGRAINTDGAMANNDFRSLLKVPVYDYQSLIQLSGFTLVRYAFCSENPDLYSDHAAGFISETTSGVQPTSIPQNAKWIIYDIFTDSIQSSVVATYTNPKLSDKINNKTANPILKNHWYEIRYRGTAQLCWDDVAKKLYWTDGFTSDPSGAMIEFYFGEKCIMLGISDVKERAFSSLDYNAQLLLPLPEGSTSPLYTLNDIVVLNGITYDETAYVKIAHITYMNAISSFICQKEVKDNVIIGIHNDISSVKADVLYNHLDVAEMTVGYNYANDLIIDGNILDTGILNYISGRYAVFFKMAEKGTTPTITADVSPYCYQWYSGKPDYITGSNSLGRTLTNTPPSDAEYCGMTYVSGRPTSIIISGNSETKELKNAIGVLGTNLNNSVGENCFANGLRTNLKILGYGNSFMRNSVAYLSAIANGCGVNLTVGNLYTGGTELQNHLTALRNNSAEYLWYKYVNGVETQAQNNQTPMRGLLEERWDAIIVHQYIPWQYPFEPTLNQFLKLIIERLGYTPKIYINATWAGSLDGNETYYGYETEDEMWEAMLTYVKGACVDSGVQEFSIIPTGTAIQNARTLSWADDYNRFVNASPDLHHLNPAGGFIAACTLYQKIVAPLNGVDCSNTTFRITSATSMPPESTVQPGILVTDDNYAALCKCAVDAVNSPYVVTQQ